MKNDQKKIKENAREIKTILYLLADNLPNLNHDDAVSYVDEVTRQVGEVARIVLTMKKR